MSKRAFQEFATLYFEFKDTIEDNEKLLDELKKVTQMGFDDCEEILIDAKKYESNLNYAKFEVMQQWEKNEIINTLLQYIDKLMNLQTKLNIAKDRARQIAKDRKKNDGRNYKQNKATVSAGGTIFFTQ